MGARPLIWNLVGGKLSFFLNKNQTFALVKSEISGSPPTNLEVSGRGTFIFVVQVTDDVMSDCVDGDYIIGKMPKNAEIGDTDFRKGMTSRPPLKVLNVSLDCLLCPVGPVRLYFLTVKSYSQKLFKKLPFFRQFSTLNPSRF